MQDRSDFSAGYSAYRERSDNRALVHPAEVFAGLRRDETMLRFHHIIHRTRPERSYGMKYYDITLPISDSLVLWPGDPPVQISQPSNIERGDTATITRISMGAHTGTHVDAPLHFIKDGGAVDTLLLDDLIGEAVVIDATGNSEISASVLGNLGIPPGTKRILFKTDNSRHWERKESAFFTDYVAISDDGAVWLIENGCTVVGIDYLSIAPFYDTVSTHKTFLKAGVIVIEGIDLSSISPGNYHLICLPLKLQGGEGAPARVVLMHPGNDIR